VIAVSRRSFALSIARRCGAWQTIQLDEPENIAARLKELTGKSDCERVIEAAGEQQSLDVASALTAERGRLIIAGYHQDSERRVNMQQWNWRGIDVVNAHERDPSVYVAGIREAVAEVSQGKLHPSFLMTHDFTLERLAKAFHTLEQRPDGFLKAWIRISA
jgi:threonine dehydrogenase-like Zn-dependent dehydrogenase